MFGMNGCVCPSPSFSWMCLQWLPKGLLPTPLYPLLYRPSDGKSFPCPVYCHIHSCWYSLAHNRGSKQFIEQRMSNLPYFWDSLPSSLQLLNENTEDRLLCVSNWRLWIREKGSGSPFLFSSLQISIPTDCLPLLTRLLWDSGTSLGRLLNSSQRKMSPLWIRALSHTVFGRRTYPELEQLSLLVV